jgi:hypothetical protein
LLTFEVDRIALIQHFESFFLDGGKMHEDIFACGPLDESIPLGTVKPLHYTAFAHKKPFLLAPLPYCVQGNSGKEVLPSRTKTAYPNPRFLSGEIALRHLGFLCKSGTVMA